MHPTHWRRLLLNLTWTGLLGIQLCTQLRAQPSSLPDLEPAARQWVEDTLTGMALEEKVGQLIVATTPTAFTNVTLPPFEKLRDELHQYHLGGMHAFRGTALGAAYLLRRLQAESRIPLLLTSDLEGGAGLIFQGATRFPRAMALGAAGDPELTREVARMTAREARRIGVNVSFSPVADVNINPRNPIINTRSFGEDPARVAEMTGAFIEGLQAGGVLATAKHFPGHGDTEIDSHLELAVIPVDRRRLDAVELFPFRAAIHRGVAAIMTAHLAVPVLDPQTNRPATLSRPILTDLLRNELGFSGLIVTDAMNMYAISKNYPEGESAVQAMEAGADVILYPESVAKTYQALLEAARSGRLSLERIEQSVRRILQAKARLGLDRTGLSSLDDLDRDLGSAEAEALSQQVMEKAITLVRNQKNSLPFRKRRGSSLLLISVFDRYATADSRGDTLSRALRDRGLDVVTARVDSDTSQQELNLMVQLARRVNFVVAAVFVKVSAFQGSLDLGERQQDLLTRLAGLRTPNVAVAFGSPYLLSSVPTLTTFVTAFDDLPAAETAAARLLLGEILFQGKLPITLPGDEPEGKPTP